MKEQKPENLKRRGFLLAAGVGSAGAVAAVAVGVGKDAAQSVATVKTEDKTGAYAETAHVANYYRTARI